jgi:hypothetical protein
MNGSPHQPRTPYNLSESTHQRLNSYVLAASAAGVGMLALTLPAEAKIIYTSTHQVIKKGVSYKLDLNHDGKIDFTLRVEGSANTSSSFKLLSALPVAGNGVRGFGGNPGWASALKAGSLVGPYQYFPGQAMAEVARTAGSGVNYSGSWVNVKNRFLGLRFKIAGKIHYGWARLSVQATKSSVIATLTGYAYETIPKKPLRAGQTKGGEDDTSVGRLNSYAPGSSTLGVLAMGSRGRSVCLRRELARASAGDIGD